MTPSNKKAAMLVRTEHPADHIALLRLADDSKRNALSPALIGDLLAALQTAVTDGARAIIIAGGAKFFCAGADINGLRDNHWLDVQPTGINPYDLFQAIERNPCIVIAAVAGLALGGGFELTLCCDLAVAGTGASFALPEIGLGVMPNSGIARLAEMCGTRRALEIVLTRRPVSAAEALSLGFVNACVAGTGVDAAAVALAQTILGSAPPASIAAAKLAMRNLNGAAWPEIQGEIAHLDRAEWTEGLGSFLDRRTAEFEPFWRNRKF